MRFKIWLLCWTRCDKCKTAQWKTECFRCGLQITKDLWKLGRKGGYFGLNTQSLGHFQITSEPSSNYYKVFYLFIITIFKNLYHHVLVNHYCTLESKHFAWLILSILLRQLFKNLNKLIQLPLFSKKMYYFLQILKLSN